MTNESGGSSYLKLVRRRKVALGYKKLYNNYVQGWTLKIYTRVGNVMNNVYIYMSFGVVLPKFYLKNKL